MTFKVGDRVVHKNEGPGTVERLVDFYIEVRLDDKSKSVSGGGKNGAWNSLVSELTLEEIVGAASPTTNKLNEEASDMSALSTINSAKLDKETRLLQQQSLECQDGTPTSDGLVLMNQKLWEANRSAYAKELQAALKTQANEQAAYNKSVSADKDED